MKTNICITIYRFLITIYRFLITIYRFLITNTLFMVNGILVSILYILSLGALRRFNQEVLCRIFARLILKLIGIKLVVDPLVTQYEKNVIYMFNHNSFLDILIIPALGLSYTRNILSVRTIVIIPISLCAFGCGTFFIPFKDKPEKRLAFFKRMIDYLLSTQDNLLCAPEGVHRFLYGIHNFNRGVFHMALESNRDIVCLYFDIPKKEKG